jgi:hypothetical protein
MMIEYSVYRLRADFDVADDHFSATHGQAPGGRVAGHRLGNYSLFVCHLS